MLLIQDGSLATTLYACTHLGIHTGSHFCQPCTKLRVWPHQRTEAPLQEEKAMALGEAEQATRILTGKGAEKGEMCI